MPTNKMLLRQLLNHKRTLIRVRTMSSATGIVWPKHLAAGSECPPLEEDVVTFYNMKFCPYAHRTLLVLIAKYIPYTMVNVHLKSKPDWFLAKNPLGKVPVIQFGDTILYESLVVSEFLDDVFPGPQLLPLEPLGRTKAKMLVELFTPISLAMVKFFFAKTEEDRTRRIAQLHSGLEVTEIELGRIQTNYLSGPETPMFTDYMVWPWFERIEGLHLLVPGATAQDILPKSRFPRQVEWLERMKEDPVVASCQIEAKYHVEFFKSLASGTPDYDMPVS